METSYTSIYTSMSMTNFLNINTHDELSFEDIKRPVGALMFYDKDDVVVLERYFGDIKNLFLKKFSVFSSDDDFSEKDSSNLRSILEEMIKVKSLLRKANTDESYL